ncbi:MAG: hypothetical protein AB7V16_07005 [Vulcanibacillus sp.]
MKLNKEIIIEGNVIKEGAEIELVENKILEAFGSGKSALVAEKVLNVLGRKIGKTFNFSEVPINYENSYGQFTGYVGLTNDSLMIRINFKLGATSDSIESFDVYLNGVSDAPDYTIETTGLNIIEIVNTVTESLIDEGELNDNVLHERGQFSTPEEIQYILDKWITDDKSILKDLQSKGVPEIFSGVWDDWVKDKPNYKGGIKYYLFAKGLKQFLLSRGLTNKTYRARKNGSKERQIEDPVLADQLDSIVETLSWKEKFAFIDLVVQDAIKGNTKSVIVKGSPGSGKTYQILQSLDKGNAKYKTYSGGVKSLDDLIRILYNNANEDMILVFDDFDSVLSKSDSANIFKAILQDIPERIVTYVDVGRDSKKNMSDIPPKFSFYPSIIFITNKTKMDAAIESRSVVLDITLTNDEVLEKIEDSLKEYRPEIDINIKRTALEFCQEISKGVKTIDFRMMDNVLRAIQLSPSNWKKIALWMMKSV